jgi:tRNA-dihydrouridine synthase B
VTEKVSLSLLHLEKSLEFKDGKRAIYEMRRHFSNYFKGLPDFRETRIKLLTSLDVEEIRELINGISVRWGDYQSNERTSVYGI